MEIPLSSTQCLKDFITNQFQQPYLSWQLKVAYNTSTHSQENQAEHLNICYLNISQLDLQEEKHEHLNKHILGSSEGEKNADTKIVWF